MGFCVGGAWAPEKSEKVWLIQVKAYVHSERFRLKFCRNSAKLRGFDCFAFLGRISNGIPYVIYYYTSQKAVLD